MPPIDQHVPWSRSGNKEDDQEGLGNTSKKSTGEDGRDEGMEIVVWRQRAFGVDCWLADCGVLPAMRSRRRWRRTGDEDLFACILVSFGKEKIIIWRGKDR